MTEQSHDRPPLPPVAISGISGYEQMLLNAKSPDQMREDLTYLVVDSAPDITGFENSDLSKVLGVLNELERLTTDTAAESTRAIIGVWAARLAHRAGAVIEENR